MKSFEIILLTDGELELKLKALVKADIIQQGQTNYDYRGVGAIFAWHLFFLFFAVSAVWFI